MLLEAFVEPLLVLLSKAFSLASYQYFSYRCWETLALPAPPSPMPILASPVFS